MNNCSIQRQYGACGFLGGYRYRCSLRVVAMARPIARAKAFAEAAGLRCPVLMAPMAGASPVPWWRFL